MANEKTTFNFWPLIIVVAIIGYLLYAYNRKCCPIGIAFNPNQDCDGCDPITRYVNVFLRRMFAPKLKDSYQECVEKNKKLKDGDPCNTCESTETQPIKSGVIKNGICVPASPSEPVIGQIQIANQNGASIYKIDTTMGHESLKPTNQIIPPASKMNYVSVVNMTHCDINSQACYPPTNFYKLSNNQGYIIYTDASLFNPTA